MNNPVRARIAALGIAVLVAGCASETPYQPINAGSQVSGGYSNVRLSPDRYRVMFSGNTMTSRQTVETYLLYRSAELTSQQGFDWFEMAERNTDRNTRTYVDRPFSSGQYGWWGPAWRYRRGPGWTAWDPYRGDPFWGDTLDVRTVNQYEASAEIIMHRGSAPDQPRAFNARDILATLGPNIQQPS